VSSALRVPPLRRSDGSPYVPGHSLRLAIGSAYLAGELPQRKIGRESVVHQFEIGASARSSLDDLIRPLQ
jgi:hypothetical protein